MYGGMVGLGLETEEPDEQSGAKLSVDSKTLSGDDAAILDEAHQVRADAEKLGLTTEEFSRKKLDGTLTAEQFAQIAAPAPVTPANELSAEQRAKVAAVFGGTSVADESVFAKTDENPQNVENPTDGNPLAPENFAKTLTNSAAILPLAMTGAGGNLMGNLPGNQANQANQQTLTPDTTLFAKTEQLEQEQSNITVNPDDFDYSALNFWSVVSGNPMDFGWRVLWAAAIGVIAFLFLPFIFKTGRIGTYFLTGLFFVGFTPLSLWFIKINQNRIKNFAKVNGLEYTEEADFDPSGALRMSIGRNRRSSLAVNFGQNGEANFFRWKYTIGQKVTALNFILSNGNSVSNGEYITISVAHIKISRNVPHIVLLAKKHNFIQSGTTMKNQLAILGNVQKIELEGDFADYFDVYAPNDFQIDTLQILTPDVMETLVGYKGKFDVEISGEDVFFYGSKDAIFHPLVLAGMLEAAVNFAKTSARNVAEYHDERQVTKLAGSSDPNAPKQVLLPQADGSFALTDVKTEIVSGGDFVAKRGIRSLSLRFIIPALSLVPLIIIGGFVSFNFFAKQNYDGSSETDQKAVQQANASICAEAQKQLKDPNINTTPETAQQIQQTIDDTCQ